MSIKRNVYLETLPLPEAVATIRAALDRDSLVGSHSIAAHDAAGRVLSAPVFARYSAPTVHSAAMDGYAVCASTTFEAREGQPLELIDGENCFAVNTGHPLPEGCDAVIMIEHCDVRDSTHISIEKPAFPWQHVRRIGEDIVATELLYPRNHVLSAYDVGALLAGGIWEVDVWESLHIRIIPTGDEVLDFTRKPDPGKGQVVESNSQVLRAMASALGCCVERIPPVADSPEALHAALQDSLNAGMHITIFCAGSSAGTKDFTRATIEREGRILVHGIAAMPGKPSLAGLCHGRLVIGAPGYPVSSVVCFEEMLSPVISWLHRKPLAQKPEMTVELMRKVPSRLGIEEFVRLSVGRVGDKAVAIPLGRGAGNITTLTRAQAITRIPASVEGLAEGSVVSATLTVPQETLDNILICVGSHDNTLDLLADALMGLDDPFRLV
ncbi:MAG: molybdopterin-binding protein, partial [Desulfovibrionaceae bacterium]